MYIETGAIQRNTLYICGKESYKPEGREKELTRSEEEEDLQVNQLDAHGQSN